MKASRKLFLVSLALFLFIFLPTYSSVPLEQQEMMLAIRDVFIQTSVAYLWLSPAIHIATIVLLVALFLWGQKIGRIANAFFGVLFLFMAFSNHIAVTGNYGLVVITGNVVQIAVVSLFWLWDVLESRSKYVLRRLPAWRYWVVPLAFLAFWSPISPDLSPDFNPLLLLTSSFGVMFCPTTPVVVALLTLNYPTVNKHVLWVTSFVGFLIGLFNAMSLFIMPGYSQWNFILHIPLISISLYGLLITRIVREPLAEQGKSWGMEVSRSLASEQASLAISFFPILSGGKM